MLSLSSKKAYGVIMNSISNNIKVLREKAGLTQEDLATKTGINSVQLSKYERGVNTPGGKNLSKIAEALGISIDQISGSCDKQENFGFQPHLKLIPVFTSVPAGWPCEGYVAEEPLAYIPFEGNGRNMGALLVDGHSMSPDIKDGEYVVYVEDYDFKPGDRLVVTNEFGKSMVKEYAIKDGEPWLISVNPEYSNHKVNEGFKLIGRVIEIYSKRKVGRR